MQFSPTFRNVLIVLIKTTYFINGMQTIILGAMRTVFERRYPLHTSNKSTTGCSLFFLFHECRPKEMLTLSSDKFKSYSCLWIGEFWRIWSV